MKSSICIQEQLSAPDISAIGNLIVKTQKNSGEIPWFSGDKTDPWDHIESGIGLSIAGYLDKAKKAFEWIKQIRIKNGTLYSSYKNGIADNKTRDSNMCSYIAVGVYYYFLITQDMQFLKDMWNTVCSGIDFALSLQTKKGNIYWAVSPENKVDNMSLLTGSSSVFMSIKCALAIAEHLKIAKPQWITGILKLKNALEFKPYLFNIAKARFSMDWFYPVLCGALTEDKALKRIDKYWKKFVVSGHGVKCVSDEPWITLAESAELILTLSAVGDFRRAETLFNWICDKRFDDETFWCGYTYQNMVIWPEDKITWTNAVILMAWDALYNLTPGSVIFKHDFWKNYFSNCTVNQVQNLL